MGWVSQQKPNPTILGSLRPHLRPYHNWLVVGDWNVPAEDTQDTSLCSSIGGSIVACNCSTFEGGNELDYGISSRNLCSLVSAEVDWGVPFKPHAAVRFSLDAPSGQLALPQLQGFKGSIKEDDPGPVPQRPVELGMIGTVPLRRDSMTVAFAAFTQQAADRHFGEADGRGTHNPTTYKPLMQQASAFPWHGMEAAWWQRLLKILEMKLPPPDKLSLLLQRMPPEARGRTAMGEAVGGTRLRRPTNKSLRDQAVTQACSMRALTPRDFARLIKGLPKKASGIDGWSVDLLKALSEAELADLASVWRSIELGGDLPHQLTFTSFVMLPKSATIERLSGS